MWKSWQLLLVTLIAMVTILSGCAAPAPTPALTPTPAPAPTPALTPTPAPAPTPTLQPAPTPIKPIKMKISTFEPPNSAINQALEQWAKLLKERTGGRVELTLYPAETLGKLNDQWEMVKKGISDVSWIFPSFYKGVFPLSDYLSLYFSIPERSVSLSNDLYNKYFYREFREVKVFWPYIMPPPRIHSTKKPVRTLEDLKGMQVRGPGGMEGNCLKALGATPVQIPIPEVYTSLERGLVDGATHPWNAYYSFRLYEVTKYTTMRELSSALTVVVMNLERWNSLPPDIQKVFDELSPVGQQLDNDLVNKEDDMGLAAAKKAGRELIYLTPEEEARWIEAVKPIYIDWATKMDAMKLPGTELMNYVSKLKAK